MSWWLRRQMRGSHGGYSNKLWALLKLTYICINVYLKITPSQKNRRNGFLAPRRKKRNVMPLLLLLRVNENTIYFLVHTRARVTSCCWMAKAQKVARQTFCTFKSNNGNRKRHPLLCTSSTASVFKHLGPIASSDRLSLLIRSLVIDILIVGAQSWFSGIVSRICVL